MENKIKDLATCKVCGREFPLIVEEHYISKEPGKTGFVALAGGSIPMLWDSFDCPHCGCQNRMQTRYRLTDNLGQDYPLDLDDNPDDEPVCDFMGGKECYAKDSCGPDCKFHPDHPDHKVENDE